MRDQQSSRSRQLLRVGQVGVKSLLKEPVKEAVREALAEERTLAGKRTSDDDQTELTDQPEETEHEDASEGGNRILRPAILLPVLGLAVVVAVLKRRRLMEFAKEKGVGGQDDETDSTHDSNLRTTTASDSTDTDGSRDTKYSTSPDAYDGDTDDNESTGSTARSGSADNGDYDLDSDNEGLSKTE